MFNEETQEGFDVGGEEEESAVGAPVEEKTNKEEEKNQE